VVSRARVPARRARDTTRARARLLLVWQVKKSLKSDKKGTYFVKNRVFELHSVLYEKFKSHPLTGQVIFFKISRIIGYL